MKSNEDPQHHVIQKLKNSNVQHSRYLKTLKCLSEMFHVFCANLLLVKMGDE